jgi:fructokinase
MSHRITSLGEVVIDFLPIVEDGRTVGFRMYPGGSPMNVALGVARLGHPAGFAGALSRDYFGRSVRTFLDAEGVDTRFLIDLDAPSTLSFVAVERGEPAYTFYGAGAADARFVPTLVDARLIEQSAVIHVGSVAIIRQPTADTLLWLCGQAAGRCLISFDPNIRAALVDDDAGYRRRIEQLFGLADVVKLSTVDLAWIMPDAAPDQAAQHILARGAGMVVITDGEHGLAAWRAGAAAAIRVPARPVRVVDTIGAGDTVDAALLVALAERRALTRAALQVLDDDQLAACLHFAAAAAAITCSRAGADLPRRAEIATPH